MKPKLLLVSSSYPRWLDDDVTGRFMQDCAQELSKDFEVIVLAPWTRGSKKEEILEGIKVIRHRQCFAGIEFAYGDGLLGNLKKNNWKFLFLPFYFLFQLMAISAECKKRDIQILNPHWIIPQGFLCVLYKNLFNSKVKVIAYSHGTDLLGLNGFLGRALKKYTLHGLDGLLVTSDKLKDTALSLSYQGKLVVQAMGIDTQMFHPSKRLNSIKSELRSDPILLYSGALLETKGLLELIDALPVVLKAYPTGKLVLIGDGAAKEPIITRAKVLGISSSIHFTGILSHRTLCGWMASADLFILPSHSEGFSVVVAEAMSSKIPVLMTEGIGIADTIRKHYAPKPQELIFETPLKDSRALALNILRILDERSTLLPRLTAARNYIESQFSWTVVGEKIRIFFKSCTG